LASSEFTSSRDQNYTTILKNLPFHRLEEILTLIEKSIKEYLDEKLTKHSDYTLVASISRNTNSVDLVVDLRIDRCITIREKCEDLVNDALNYARKKIEEYLDNLSTNTPLNSKSF